ncbi:MAG TPA: hypothetical protein VET27_23335 [Mycobacterium sp.]|nr:hypothetical protein [Mycobacterium sp.]
MPGPVGESAPQVMAPLVTVGNGRSPGLPTTRPGDLPARIVGGPAVPQTVTALPAPPEGSSVTPPQPLLAVEPAPWPLAGTPVASLWGSVQPGWPAGVLFGIAGLLLAPIAGVWLGHRQARAVKAASQLVSR